MCYVRKRGLSSFSYIRNFKLRTDINRNSLIKRIREQLPPEFTAKEAKGLFASNYQAPQKLLESLVHDKVLIRLKRDLYVLPDNYDPITAASAIAQPSYISFETALSYYGLIPERVYTILSVVDGRSAEHEVMGVRYIYRSQKRDLFAKGMSSIRFHKRNVLFASKEKALLDTLAWQGLTTKDLLPRNIFSFVCDSYRIEPDALIELSIRKLESLSGLYRSRAPALLVAGLRDYKKGKRR